MPWERCVPEAFDGKAVIVTGAGSGIGRAAAEMFAGQGAAVTVADIDLARAEAVVKEIRNVGRTARAAYVDVARSDSVAELIDNAVAIYGRLDSAFNNAGVPGEFHDLLDCSEPEWDKVFDCNVRGVWLCMKHEIAAMLKGGGGAIVNTSSGAGLVAPARMGAYTASKHAVIGLTRSAAVDFGPFNIRVNAICPGMTSTPMLDATLEAVEADTEAIMKGLALRRFGSPAEPAAAAVWLCSEGASYITGASLTVDGGLAIA